jgi:hypothetical protein
VTSDDVHVGGPGGVEGRCRSSSPLHHIMLKMALVDTSWWLSRLGVGDEGSSWSRGMNEAIITSLLLFLPWALCFLWSCSTAGTFAPVAFTLSCMECLPLLGLLS